VWLGTGGEYQAVEGRRDSQRPTTVVLGSLVDTNGNVISLQLLAKYQIVKI
jgi:hypothetical protein